MRGTVFPACMGGLPGVMGDSAAAQPAAIAGGIAGWRSGLRWIQALWAESGLKPIAFSICSLAVRRLYCRGRRNNSVGAAPSPGSSHIVVVNAALFPASRVTGAPERGLRASLLDGRRDVRRGPQAHQGDLGADPA